MPPPLVGRWLRARDVEAAPTKTFRQWWINTRTSGRSRDERARRHPPEGLDRPPRTFPRENPTLDVRMSWSYGAVAGDVRCASQLRRV